MWIGWIHKMYGKCSTILTVYMWLNILPFFLFIIFKNENVMETRQYIPIANEDDGTGAANKFAIYFCAWNKLRQLQKLLYTISHLDIREYVMYTSMCCWNISTDCSLIECFLFLFAIFCVATNNTDRINLRYKFTNMK